MVKLASEKNQKGIENGDIHFAVGDCCDLAFEDQVFDIVVTMNTLKWGKKLVSKNILQKSWKLRIAHHIRKAMRLFDIGRCEV